MEMRIGAPNKFGLLTEWWDFTKKPQKKIRQVVIPTTIDEEVIASIANTVATHVTKAENLGLSNTYLAMNDAWIIDKGATDHMTNNSTQFSSIWFSTQPHILIANGGVTLVTGKGSVHVSNSINLDIVLVVPYLSSNTLSVSKITKALNCTVIFWPDKCVFQDMATQQTIG
ncbi:hypothetical protein PVK06_034449 [Gossypium arboreum]|uniref:Retrovirus-related Pol polyprotein from transposon TNT 1-94-like beta-barrel domain-containing protein n=1 Tax=Gossypium arboreum TaxID=29729 RepID=A0ABR0NF36_GOSAR|nr:hypothetical protein PVK06_034449 [Gossypium arboreum]